MAGDIDHGAFYLESVVTYRDTSEAQSRTSQDTNHHWGLTFSEK
jgi:hypothetical protein